MRHLCRALLLVTCLALPSLAQDLSGVYRLQGQQWIDWSTKEEVAVLFWLRLRPDGDYDVARRHTYADGQRGPLMYGRGHLAGAQLSVRWDVKQGASDVLVSGAAARGPETAGYAFGPDRSLDGSTEALTRAGAVATYWESGRWVQALSSKPQTDQTGSDPAGSDTTGSGPADSSSTGTEAPASDARVAGLPDGGAYLVGEALALDAPARVVEGPGRIAEGRLTLTGPGAVALAGQDGTRITVHAVQPRIRSITVIRALPIEDALPPHWRAPQAADAQPSWEPALLLMGQPLELRVVLEADRDLTRPARIALRGRAGAVELSARSQVDRLRGGHAVELKGAAALSDAIRIHQLDLAWSLRDGQDQRDLAALGRTSLRVYTTFAAPRVNRIPRHPDSQPAGTKLHLELVCGWANGASRHVANGEGSICEALDNGFRHLVHPSDHGPTPPPIPHYAPDAPKPLNYDQIPADTGGKVMNGARMPSSIFYPDAEDDYETHYRQNYGWYVLENPQHTGGRCNQQASLIADLFGTAGVDAKVYYIERKGLGRQSGRPLLRYYVASDSGKSWNFHGLAQVTLPDGRLWIYDGSGSRPPERINGSPDELFVLDGPFVKYWKPYWKYADTLALAPEADWPTEYVGTSGRVEKGQWRGVPLQPGEEPLLPGQ